MPLTQVFASISDPRSARHTLHDLAELLTVTVCAVLSGVDDFVDIELWAQAKIDWLRGFMKLEHGIPSHDTIGRVFGLIAPDEFESAFRCWVGMVVPALAGDTVVPIDGKTSRRTGAKSKADASPLHLVSAFAAGMGVVLGQTATAAKSNEITAIPELLVKLAIEGCVVTIDAIGTQTKIARTIRERGAHYVLCVNENHPNLYDSILFADIDPCGPLTPSSTHEATIQGHGRTEVRRCRAYAATDRLYKCGDWEIENRLHWCLDVQFSEDQSRVRSGYAAHNLAIVRHIVMNLLRLNTTRKASIKSKRMLAATIDEFRAELLGGMT